MPRPRIIYEAKPGSPLEVNRAFYTRLAEGTEGRGLVERFVVPRRTGRAWPVRAGQLCRIVAVEGPQVADLNVWSLDNPRERFWASRTRQLHQAHLSTFDRLWSCLPYLRPMLTITNDTTNHGLDLGTGKLDLTDEDMIVYSTAANLKPDIQALINNARNNGTQGQWSGSGITSTSAKNEPHQNGTLGVLNNVEFVNVIPFVSGERGFDGTKVTNSTSAPAVLVKYTYYGDTDFNGKVDFDDYVRTDNAYNNHIADGGWLNGDFDGDGGLVDFDDYVLIDLGFNTQSGIRAPHSWADVAQMDHFPQEGYEQYLIDALAQLGIHVTDQDFHP